MKKILAMLLALVMVLSTIPSAFAGQIGLADLAEIMPDNEILTDLFLEALEGGPLEIGFNNKYLLDALKASKQEELVFHFTGSLSPCVIRPKDNDDFTYLVLPVRFKND